MHHDIMNPLSTAKGFTELLKEEKDSNMMYIETIEKNLLKPLILLTVQPDFQWLTVLNA